MEDPFFNFGVIDRVLQGVARRRAAEIEADFDIDHHRLATGAFGRIDADDRIGPETGKNNFVHARLPGHFRFRWNTSRCRSVGNINRS